MEPIILVRHAHPEDPVDPAATSHWTDCPLSARGRKEAECVAERLARELNGRPVRVVSSDLKRAWQTAEAICRQLRAAPPEPARELREFNNGIGDNLDAMAAKSRREALAALADDAEAAGESWPAFYGRVSGRMERVLREQDRLTIVVSHYGTIIQTLTWWTGLGLNAAGDTPLGFGSTLTALSVLLTDKRGKRVLDRVNDSAHLQAAGIGGPIFAAGK